MSSQLHEISELFINPDHIRFVRFKACPETERLVARVWFGDDLYLDLDSDETEVLKRFLTESIAMRLKPRLTI